MVRWLDDLIVALGSLWFAYFCWSILKINKQYNVHSSANIAFGIMMGIFCAMSVALFWLSFQKFKHKNK